MEEILRRRLNTPTTDSAPADPDRAKYLARLDRALLGAFACLAPRERMLLTCYYVDQLTLGEIGRIVGEHESTVSRQLERTRRALRETVDSICCYGPGARMRRGMARRWPGFVLVTRLNTLKTGHSICRGRFRKRKPWPTLRRSNLSWAGNWRLSRGLTLMQDSNSGPFYSKEV